MRAQLLAALTALMLAGCGQSQTDAAAGSSTVVADAEATAAAIRAQTGGAAAPGASGVAVETTSAGGPKRRDGWWELSSTAQSSKQHLCVGAGSEEKFAVFDQILFSLGDCASENFKRQGAGWAFDLRCDMVGTAMTAKGTISGDFRNSFRVDQTVTADGSATSGTIYGVHKGACPAQFKPGDLVSDGAVLMNVAR